MLTIDTEEGDKCRLKESMSRRWVTGGCRGARLGMAAEMGVPITFASDAHAPTEVGLNFSEAVQLAREAGYTSYCRFTNRRRDTVRM